MYIVAPRAAAGRLDPRRDRAVLSSQDSAHLEQALRVMLAPQAYGEGRTWGDAVCASVSALLPEAMVGLMRITPGGPFTHTPLPLADQVAYVRHYASLDPAAAPQVARRLEVAHRWSLVPRDEVRGTEFHEDWLRPRRLEDALWLNTFDGAKLRHRIFLSFDAVLATDQRARMETLLRLLAPAFRAGTAALDQHGSDPDVLLRTLDALAHGAMLVDADGRTRHRSATLERLLAADPERPRLEAALSSAAQAVATLAFDRPSARSRSHGPPLRPAERQVATRARTYTVRATLVVGDVPRTLVELIPAGAPAPAIQPISGAP